MILGVGNDVVDIRRIEKTLGRFNDRFINRVFTENEMKKSENRKNRAASYAKRFAAKEACAKALGTGIAKGVFWRNMEVKNHKSGKPYMELSNGAEKILRENTPNGKNAEIHLTLTDDYPYAQAIVIIEAN